MLMIGQKADGCLDQQDAPAGAGRPIYNIEVGDFHSKSAIGEIHHDAR
jgi:hypothetical protein